METDRRYPLHWPQGWRRTKYRHRSRYKVTEARARDSLINSLEKMGGRKIILSTNIVLRQDGLPYANRPAPTDVGAAVYWMIGDKELCLAADKWDSVASNMRALGLAVEALRQLARCGASEILDRAFAGFHALPAEGGAPNWRIELGFDESETPTPEHLNSNYRARAKQAAKSEESLLRLNQARELALAEIEEL